MRTSLYRDKKDGKILILTSMGLSGISGEFVDTLGTPYRAGLEYLDYMGCISKKEEIELSYLYLEGYRYLTKEQDGKVKLWRNLPKRFKLAKGSFWTVQEGVSYEGDWCRPTHGDYNFTKWEDAPIAINEIVDVRGIK
ncbi:hypothetical protein [Bacillus paranthracis]|uniref:hypothetical protein n=1 Tax=Bacillus paranthracis TaxID=2026186 RepID=UPI002FDBC5DD